MEDFKKSLQSDKEQIDNYIASQSEKLLDAVKHEYGEKYSDVLAAYLDVLGRGGKRLRGILAKRAYEYFGGSNENVALEAALVIELLHDYLLVVDDIQDDSSLRRGKPAAHMLLREYHEKHQLAGDKAHYGLSQTINAALAGQNIAFQRALALPIESDAKVNALAHLNDFLTKTDFGQLGDFNNEAFKTTSKADVMQVLQLKTAYYTFCMPVYFGASLAGMPKINANLNDYLINTGICFQLYDDIIGTFGDTTKTGKSNRSDIIEGKRTLLVIYALESATSEQKATLAAALGNKNLSDEEFIAVQDILRSTGALKRCQNEAQSLVSEANQSIERANLSPDATQFFTYLASYVLSYTEV
ncbi:MAG: polyprenyl synthetase family protein [Candidatus Nomurabacteria bacterium]|jgi:geranylgeranyl pyrophosphate synthase|nr:polyprenyl synthetase family protein [Candidatus Nomurabacteria bacterium]